MSLLELIKHQQEQIIAKVNYLTSKLNPAGQDMEMPENPVDFPLTSIEEVENFEEWLRNPANNQIKLSVVSVFFFFFQSHYTENLHYILAFINARMHATVHANLRE